MKILVDIGHPAHVHFFKNTIWNLKKKGHKILVTARNKDVAVDLLKAYGIEHRVLTSMQEGKGNLFKEWVIRDYRLLQIAKEFNPDVLTGVLNPCVAHTSWLLGKKSIIFNDTENARLAEKITYPFSTVVYTPSCFKTNIGRKQVKYRGNHELAYLHPNYFTPEPGVLEELGLREKDKIIILRFVSRGASHDIGHRGLSLEDKRKAVEELEKYGCVLISSEGELLPEFKKYRVSIAPEKMHHLLYYSTLLYGESATMASECAVLGTHAIFCDHAGRGYTNEEENYELVYNFFYEKTMGEESLKKAVELLKNPTLKKDGLEKRKRLLEDKIDVTRFIVECIENGVLCP